MRKDPRVQTLISEARMYGELKEQPGWRRLFERLQKQRDGYMHRIARRMMSGQDVSKEEIVHTRAFYLGALYAVKHPEVAEQHLESAAKLAFQFALQEEESSEAPPYE